MCLQWKGKLWNFEVARCVISHNISMYTYYMFYGYIPLGWNLMPLNSLWDKNEVTEHEVTKSRSLSFKSLWFYVVWNMDQTTLVYWYVLNAQAILNISMYPSRDTSPVFLEFWLKSLLATQKLLRRATMVNCAFVLCWNWKQYPLHY